MFLFYQGFFIFLSTLRRYHSQPLPARNDKRHMSVYNGAKLLFI